MTISGCVCSHNWRQGISVISVDGLLIENTVMRATIRKPSKGFMDDYRIDLSGIPGVMFLSPKKYWK